MAFPGSIYAPPGVYTQTFFDSPVQGLAASIRVPLILGTGSEILFQDSLEVVRGSSSSVDQRIVQEDETGRAVTAISEAGAVTLGAFDGAAVRIQVKNFPIVTGGGSGTTATNSSSINVTLNGSPVVVLAVDGTRGILTLSSAPKLTDTVKVTYFFNRTDTLITDTLTDQVGTSAPLIYGAVGQNFVITTDSNDTLAFTVDSADAVAVTLSESPTAGWTAAQVASFINSAATGTTLVASTATDNFGNTVLSLTADRDVIVGAGTANTTLGLTSGTDTARNKVFYTFQKAIVDGTNGGVTTTDPADVTVKVDGTQVIPTAVDGASGAVTLPFAPEVGAVVTCQYYFNSWQDTFDYLAHRNVTDITRCGLTPDRTDYTDGTDFVLKDDLILWGTAVLIESGTHTTGSTYFDDTQISGTLVDTRQYLAACPAYVDSSVSPPVEGRKIFTLPLTPTTGNGRNSLISSATYLSVTNGRVDLPTNRPDLVLVYWGFSLSDAVNRGAVEVTQVDSDNSRVTLAAAVPVGASVYATFYYNTIQDVEYTLTSVSEGASGVGTFSVDDADGDAMYTALYSTKSAGLATITVQFPSGSENTADTRFESPFTTTLFTGPVEEDVTVTFSTRNATLGSYTVPNPGPYYIIAGASDNFDVEIDAASLTGGFVNLSDPMGSGAGFSAQLVGDEIGYDADSGGITYEIDATNESLDLQVDGVLLNALAAADATATAANYVAALNQEAHGIFGATASAGASGSITIPAASDPSDVDDHYNGWSVVCTSGTGNGVVVRTVTDYVGSTGVLTLDGGVTYDATSVFSLWNSESAPYMTGATRFLSSTTITLGEYDALVFSYTGSAGGQETFSATGANVIVAGVYTSASALATAVQTAVNAAIAAGTLAPQVTVGTDTSGRLTFTLECDPADTAGGYLEFVTGASTAVDFAVLAGLDTHTAQGGQAKVVNAPIARVFSFSATPLVHDRIILRNRLIPGNGGSMDGAFILGLTQLEVLGGTGATQAGLTAKETGLSGIRGTVMEPTLAGIVGFGDGQVAGGTYSDARDSQPVVTFYAAGGTTAQNNVLKFTFEGTPVTVEFTDATGTAIASGASADVPLGPVASVNTILGQISAAMTTAGLSAVPVQEGAGWRLRGDLSTTAASIVVGTGSANTALGLSDGDIAYRTELDVKVLVSAMMAHANSTLSLSLFTWSGASGYFAFAGLAKRVTDSANAAYIYLQSLGNAGAGTTSSIAIDAAASDSSTLPGTGLGMADGDGGTGEDAIDGFYVTSSDTANGSGTANTSVLNSGTGQDGYVGQTYRDAITGLTFTILPRSGGSSYPAASTVTLTSRANVTTDSNLPVNTIPGLELTVSNTLDIPAGDTGLVTTYDKGGSQPSVGDVFYVSYEYTKSDYTAALFTKMTTIEAAYGSNSTENPVVLASYLAILNGAVVVAVRQVQKDSDADGDGVLDTATLAAYMAAVDDVEGALPGGVYPDTLTCLKGDSTTLFQYMAQHCDIQSSMRYRSERTAIGGLSAGTEPSDAGTVAEAIKRYRFRMVYPDLYTLSLSTSDGTVESYLVDGTYAAAAVAGGRAAPSIDVATPWTGGRIVGLDTVARVLDAVEQNQVAVRGLTVIDQQQSVIKIRQGLTTDMTSVLTKLPTVITIADEVQRQARGALERYIGSKFLAGITGQIETQMNTTLKQLKAAQIIAAYTGVSAKVSEDDPTAAEVEAYYQPVFPLLYIILTFNLRASL
jgi:hypothetical protein